MSPSAPLQSSFQPTTLLSASWTFHPVVFSGLASMATFGISTFSLLLQPPLNLCSPDSPTSPDLALHLPLATGERGGHQSWPSAPHHHGEPQSAHASASLSPQLPDVVAAGHMWPQGPTWHAAGPNGDVRECTPGFKDLMSTKDVNIFLMIFVLIS